MSALSGALRRSVAGTYLAGSAALTHRMLRGRSGERDFRRVIVVATLGRNNGIASGAHLQCAALRELGVDVELLDATSALRNPLFRISHRPGSAYVFHSGGSQIANLIASVLPHAARAYRIGYWAWELPDPPLDWLDCDRDVGEIWVPSAFSQASLARLVKRPIEVCTTLYPGPSRAPEKRPRTFHRTDDGRQPVELVAQKSGRGSARIPRCLRRISSCTPGAKAWRSCGGLASARKVFEFLCFTAAMLKLSGAILTMRRSRRCTAIPMCCCRCIALRAMACR